MPAPLVTVSGDVAPSLGAVASKQGRIIDGNDAASGCAAMPGAGSANVQLSSYVPTATATAAVTRAQQLVQQERRRAAALVEEMETAYQTAMAQQEAASQAKMEHYRKQAHQATAAARAAIDDAQARIESLQADVVAAKAAGDAETARVQQDLAGQLEEQRAALTAMLDDEQAMSKAAQAEVQVLTAQVEKLQSAVAHAEAAGQQATVAQLEERDAVILDLQRERAELVAAVAGVAAAMQEFAASPGPLLLSAPEAAAAAAPRSASTGSVHDVSDSALAATAEVSSLKAQLAVAERAAARANQRAEDAEAAAAAAAAALSAAQAQPGAVPAGASTDSAAQEEARQAAEAAAAEAEAALAARDAAQDRADELQAEHRALKAEIKAWIADYEAEHGKKPDKDAKKAIKDKYKAYDAAAEAAQAAAADAESAAEAADAAQAHADDTVVAASAVAGGATVATAAGPSFNEQRLARELERAQAQAEQARMELAQSQAMTTQVQTELGAAQARAEALSSQLAAAVAGDDAASAAVANLQNALARAQEAESDAAIATAASSARVAALERELAASERKLDQLERQLARAQATGAAAATGSSAAAPARESPVPDEVDADAVLQQTASDVYAAVEESKALWAARQKPLASSLLQRAVARAIDTLQPVSDWSSALDDLQAAQDEAAELAPGEGAVVLRSACDQLLAYAAEQGAELGDAHSDFGEPEDEDAGAPQGAGAASPADSAASPTGGARGGANPAILEKWKARAKELQGEVTRLQKELGAARKEASKAGRAAAGSSAAAGAGAAAERAAKEAKEAKEKLKKSDATVKDLRAKLRKAEQEAQRAAANSDSKEAEKAAAAAARQLEKAEKKWAKEKEDMEKRQGTELSRKDREISKLETAVAELDEQVKMLTAETKELRKSLAGASELQAQLEAAQAAQAELAETKVAVATLEKDMAELSARFKDEQLLRKKYYNQIEDMKGKIRVYCRCRPLSGSERERGNHVIVTFPDDMTVDVATERGSKQFVYDTCFGMDSTQDQVFEDTERLVQSCVDGFNVCVFAYGQTGSGKTFTMLGSDSLPGITPRAITRLYELLHEMGEAVTFSVTAYMVELYNDHLVDLFWVSEHSKSKSAGPAPRLDIKKDAQGMTTIKGAIVKGAASASELMSLFHTGNGSRAVGSTKMNAESSRSHLVFAIQVEVYNRTTKKTSRGKLSLVDLAGSERVGKTGASAERLKEAQSINKSLSALGNVISALSTNEKFIPYRDNKLTLLMQDSLGGNAKTLMIAAVSPADYNDEETLSTLMYASRVKLITNDAQKQQESAEVSKLRRIIAHLRSKAPADAMDDFKSGEGKGGDDEEEEQEGDASAAAAAPP